MSRLRVKLAIGVAVLGVVVVSAAAVAGDRGKVRTSLSGFEEVPAIMTTGEGSFKAKVSRSAPEIKYELSYAGLEGGAVTQAHIHIGQMTANGGISVFLCGGATIPGPAGTPPCPQPSGTVTGTLTPASVIGPDNQGVAVGEFAELVRAIRSGFAYANVHTTKYGGGEIRGQLDDNGDRRKRGGRDDHDDD